MVSSLLVVSSLGLPAVAVAAPGTVTLGAAPTTIDAGQDIVVSGDISPVAAGETITVKNTQGDTLGTGATDGVGAYSFAIQPDRNMTIHAEWGPDSSAPIDVSVRSVVTVRLTNVRLFGNATVAGTVSPPSDGAPVDVQLMMNGTPIATEQPAMDAAGAFVTRFRIDEPGRYVAVATFDDAQHEPGTAESAERETDLPNLHTGSHGVAVQLLERRLSDLGYHLFGINENFDKRTADAVMAFRKVHNMNRTGSVDTAVWRALADPRTPDVRDLTRTRHLEVDWSKQVMYIIQDNEVRYIMHVSTGKASTPTPFGTFHVYRKYAGYNGLWWPSYIYRGVAIHGWPDVPNYPASHGCIRVPIWHAKWIFKLANMGTRITIYQ